MSGHRTSAQRSVARHRRLDRQALTDSARLWDAVGTTVHQPGQDPAERMETAMEMLAELCSTAPDAMRAALVLARKPAVIGGAR